MANDEHVRIVKQGADAIAKWREEHPDERLELSGADLSEADVRRADLSNANLSGTNLSWANLSGANLKNADASLAELSEADLSGATLSWAHLTAANLQSAKLEKANLVGANLGWADLYDAMVRRADLSWTRLTAAHLSNADLSGADLSNANLSGTNLRAANLRETNFADAKCKVTVFADTDLSKAKGLRDINHIGPSTIGVDTLYKSRGKIPEVFLRGCGLSAWQIAVSTLHDPTLTDAAISDLLTTKLFTARAKGGLYIGGVFISYSHADAEFADKIEKELYDAGASVWRDVHDLVAGSVEKQLDKGMRIQDIVLLVLSEHSLKSDWVWLEVEWARNKEKEEGRDVLCPVALDDSWKSHPADHVLMRQLRSKHILDFSAWKTKQFASQFEKLKTGMKVNYEVRMVPKAKE